MGDNLPNINADQLTRAVAGTLSALDAPEDESLEDEDENSKKKTFEEKGKELNTGEGSKSSLQLLESLSASIDPKFSRLKDLNEAHMAYTPSTSFYGRARKVTTKKKASDNVTPKSQSKKYSSRINYKLLPPQAPNHVYSKPQKSDSLVLSPPHLVKLCPKTKTFQNAPEQQQPICLSVGNSSANPVLLIQGSEIIPILSGNSRTQITVSKALETSVNCKTNSVMPDKNLNSEVAMVKLKTSLNSSPFLSVSQSSCSTSSPSSQAFSPRSSSVLPASEASKCITQKLFPLTKMNSIVQFPVPFSVASSQAGTSNAFHLVRLASVVSPSQNLTPKSSSSQNVSAKVIKSNREESGSGSNVALSHTAVNFQSDAAAALKSPDLSLTPVTKGIISTINHEINPQSASSGCVNETFVKSITPSTRASTLTISPPLTSLNNSHSHLSNPKGPVQINFHAGNSSLLFSTSDTHKVKEGISSQSQMNPKNRSIPVAACQQIVPRISAINSLNTTSHGTGPFLIWPSQNIQLPLKLTNSNQVVLSVHPSPVSSSTSASDMSKSNLSHTDVSAANQHQNPSLKPFVESKLGQLTQFVSSNKAPASHPNIVKLLQANTLRKGAQSQRREIISSTLMPSSPHTSVTTTTTSPSMSPATLIPKTIIESQGGASMKTTAAAIFIAPSSKLASSSLVTSTSSTSMVSARKITSPSAACSSSFSRSAGTNSLPNTSTGSSPITATPISSTSSHLLSLAKSPATSRMQLTVVTDPFSPRQPLQSGNIRLPVYSVHHGAVQFDPKSSTVNLQNPKSQTAISNPALVDPLSPSTLTLRNKIETVGCLAAPISTLVAHKAFKESGFANSGNLVSKLPDCHPLSSHKTSSTLASSVSTVNDASLKPGIQSPPLPPSDIQVPNNGSKLIISPAGISQLQSLMRRKGMSEGYFVISAKRGSTAVSMNKEINVKRPFLSQSQIFNSPLCASCQPQVTSNSKSSAFPLFTRSHIESSSITVARESGRSVISSRPLPAHSVIATASTAVTNEDIPSLTRPIPHTSMCLTSSGKMQSPSTPAKSFGQDAYYKEENSKEIKPHIDEEMEEEEVDSDDESVSSSDSRSSSVALVIETNYDSDHKRTDDDTPTTEPMDESIKGDEAVPSEKEAPLNLSKDMMDDLGTAVDKGKSSSTSPEEVNENDQGGNENQSLSRIPHDPSHHIDSMRSGIICIPQSPLALTEIIRQQQCKFGLGCPPIPSPHFIPSKETLSSIHGDSGVMGEKSDNSTVTYSSSEIPFSAPESCPPSSYALMSQHTITDHQAVYERSLNTPHSFYLHDIVGDGHVHDSSDLEAAMNLQRLRECLPPLSRQNLEDTTPSSSSTHANITSPKSPLSLSSMHQMEAHTNINPPMTPNTMLINLLNRVPTPLLTNHQDLLTHPSAQENDIRLVENEQASMAHSSSKRNEHQIAEKSFSIQKSSENDLSQQAGPRKSIFDLSLPKSIPNNNDGFVHPQNALDLIASNYLPPRSKEEMVDSSENAVRAYPSAHLGENLVISSKPCQQDLFSDCVSSNMTLGGQDYCLSNCTNSVQSTTHQPCFHATSCPGPLTVTVNLDSFNSSSNATVTHDRVTISTSGFMQEGSMEQESLTNNFTLLTNNTHEKCGEAEILRHLIQNTNTSSNSQLHHQPIGLQFDSNGTLFTPQISDNQFENAMPSSYTHMHQPSASMPKNLPCSESLFDVVSLSQNISFSVPLPQESSMETYNNLDNSTLQETQSLRFASHSNFESVQMNSETELQNNSFNNGAFETNPDPAFEPNSNSRFGSHSDSDFNTSQRDPTFEAESSGAFIMSNSLSDIQTSFEGNLEKNEVAMHSRFMDDNEKIHLSGFREDGEQNEIFFGQTNPSQSQSQSNNLHLYDMNSIHHSSHDIAYQMSSLQNHQSQLDNHQGVVQQVHESSLTQNILNHQHDMQDHHAKDLQGGHHYNFQAQASHQYPVSTTPSFSDHQDDMGFIQEPSFPHFYNSNVGPNMPLFTQQCAVASEAPMLMSISNLNCPIPSYSTASGPDLQFQFHAEEVSNEGEKHPVLPSASFSPPSVADQAATPDSGSMNLYNGSFQNLTVYDMYVRGGNTEARSQMEESPVESGNFCVECNTMYKTQCKFHPCDYVYVSDMPILSHARLTLPSCLKLAASSVHGHNSTMGVIAKEKLAMRVKFGPLIGSMVSCDKLGSTRSFSLWQTFSSKNVRVIDTSDENSSNWLMFVKPARVSAEHNLVAFQHGNNIYFVTRCEVKEGQELLYWFSKDYARMLGVHSKPKSAQHQLCPHCHVCKQVFADRKQVRSHIRLQHPKPHVNKCSHCSRKFSQVSHLNAHVLAVHLRLKKFICNLCGKRFGDSSNLRKHIKSHSEERNFKCQMCGKAFRQKAHLQIHMNTHMPVKHEQCGFCGERFTRAFERKQHELQHTKQHKIECQHCSKVFYKKKVYKEHLKIHRNERNFPCVYCAKSFRNKFALTRHGPACKQRKRTLTLAPTSSESLSTMHGSSTTH